MTDGNSLAIAFGLFLCRIELLCEIINRNGGGQMKWGDHSAFILKNLGTIKKVNIARSLGTTPGCLSHHLKRMGLAQKRQKIILSEHEQYFREGALEKTRVMMSDELGVSLSTIARCLRTLGISTIKR